MRGGNWTGWDPCGGRGGRGTPHSRGGGPDGVEEHLGNVEPPPHDPTLLQVSAARGSTPPSAPTCSRCSRGRHTTSCRSSSRASRARSALGAPTWTWATGRASCSSCVPTWRGPGEHWVRAPGVVPSRWGGFCPLLGPGSGGSRLLLGPCGVEGAGKCQLAGAHL